jgi:hypothetical protein
LLQASGIEKGYEPVTISSDGIAPLSLGAAMPRQIEGIARRLRQIPYLMEPVLVSSSGPMNEYDRRPAGRYGFPAYVMNPEPGDGQKRHGRCLGPVSHRLANVPMTGRVTPVIGTLEPEYRLD